MSSSRGGVSIVEALVSITILGVSAIGLVGLSASAVRRGNQSAAAAYRNMVLSAEFARAVAVPAAALAPGSSCTTVTSGPMPFARCTRVANLTSRTQRIVVTVTAGTSAQLLPDSLVLVRARNVGALDLAGP